MRSRTTLAITRVVALAALALAGRLLLVFAPGISLSFLVLFIAGVGYGIRTGLAVGGLSRLAGDLIISGLHPVFLVMVPIEAILGGAFGVLGRVVDFGQRRDQPGWWAAGAAATAAVAATFAWSVAADTANWAVARLVASVPDATAAALWWTYVVAGLLFNAPAALFNAMIFATAGRPVLEALRLNGLLNRRRNSHDPDLT
jgi:hypothetical protein